LNVNYGGINKYGVKLPFLNHLRRKKKHNPDHHDTNGYSNGRQRLLNGEETSETRFRSNVYKDNTKESTVLEMEKNNNEEKPKIEEKPKPPAGTSHAGCDVISRFLFPIGFIVFNVGYWVAYMTQQKEFKPMLGEE